MRRRAAAATVALSALLSLAVGTSAVALREPVGPVQAGAAHHADAGRRAPAGAERLEPLPAPAAPDAETRAEGASRSSGGAGRGAVAPTEQPGAESLPSEPAVPDPAATTPVQPSPPASVPLPDCAVVACVALTFDDGPGPDTTRLLDELAARGASATFFVVGRQIARQPGVVAREVAAGDVVGNHTWDHADLTRVAPGAAATELDSTAQAIVAAGAPAPTLARPPYGSVSDLVRQAYTDRGLVGVLWDVDTEDWKNRDASITTQRALAGAHPGAIILMHDIWPSTVDAVPAVVDGLRARGFTLVTVPQLLTAPVAGHMYAHR